jgi:insecticidal toxin complex protein TccC
MASWISIIPAAQNMFARAVEAEDIKNRLDPVKIQKIDTMLDDWKSAVNNVPAGQKMHSMRWAIDIVYPANSLPNINHMTSVETLAPIARSDLRRLTRFTLSTIKRSQDMMTAYKAMGTTDNQFLLAQRRTRKKAA